MNPQLGTSSGLQPPVLLAMPGYHGTLAAVRSLGRAGIPITAADPERLAIGKWSKYTTTRVRCPKVRDSDRFIAWLLEFSRGRPRHVLLPTSDDTAWLYAQHRDELSQHFYVAAPHVSVLHRLLNKRLLAENAASVGLLTPRTFFPTSLEDIPSIAREAKFPVLVKPTTQVMYGPRTKGFFVEHARDLQPVYARLSREPYGKALREFDPSALFPMVQEFHAAAAARGVYSIAGYAREQRIVASRAARKVLQWPRRLGIGVCFEEAPLLPELQSGLQRLLERVGFSGTFEVEFLEDEGGHSLIDFNPRIYNQMGFEVSRGLPLPVLAYRDAIGEAPTEGLEELLVENQDPTRPKRIYLHSAAFQLMLRAQRATGVIGSEELSRWQEWYRAHESGRVDAALDPADVVPGCLDVAAIVRECARHPIRFLQVIARNRSA